MLVGRSLQLDLILNTDQTPPGVLQVSLCAAGGSRTPEDRANTGSAPQGPDDQLRVTALYEGQKAKLDFKGNIF